MLPSTGVLCPVVTGRESNIATINWSPVSHCDMEGKQYCCNQLESYVPLWYGGKAILLPSTRVLCPIVVWRESNIAAIKQSPVSHCGMEGKQYCCHQTESCVPLWYGGKAILLPSNRVLCPIVVWRESNNAAINLSPVSHCGMEGKQYCCHQLESCVPL